MRSTCGQAGSTQLATGQKPELVTTSRASGVDGVVRPNFGNQSSGSFSAPSFAADLKSSQ